MLKDQLFWLFYPIQHLPKCQSCLAKIPTLLENLNEDLKSQIPSSKSRSHISSDLLYRYLVQP